MFVERGEDIGKLLQHILRPGDLLLTQGAGDVGAVSMDLAQRKLQPLIAEVTTQENKQESHA